MDGRLRVGDQLIEINGQSTRNLTHAEAIELINRQGISQLSIFYIFIKVSVFFFFYELHAL